MKRFNVTRNGLLDNRGVTLVELLMGMAISAILFLAIAMAVQVQSRSSSRESSRVDMIHNLQNTAVRIRKELRMAGYQFGGTSGMNVGAFTGANLNSVTFVYDTDDDSVRESITIRLDTPADAGYSANHPRVLRVDNTNATIRPIGDDITTAFFKYFDQTGTQFANSMVNDTTGTQTNRDNIRNIEVVIQARSAKKNPDTGAYLTDQIAFQVNPRNLL